MIDMIALQEKIHKYFGVEAPKIPEMLDMAHMQMRLNFLLEELQELALACSFATSIKEEGSFPMPKVEFVQDSVLNVNPHEILDALVDLQVVLLGTVHLLGFFNRAALIQSPESISGDGVPSGECISPSYGIMTIFEEAFNRVWQANMQKVPCKSAKESKRGFKIDLKKPDGWKAANLSDLVSNFKHDQPT